MKDTKGPKDNHSFRFIGTLMVSLNKNISSLNLRTPNHKGPKLWGRLKYRIPKEVIALVTKKTPVLFPALGSWANVF